MLIEASVHHDTLRVMELILQREIIETPLPQPRKPNSTDLEFQECQCNTLCIKISVQKWHCAEDLVK